NLAGTSVDPNGSDYIVNLHYTGAPTDFKSRTSNAQPQTSNIFLLRQKFVALVHPLDLNNPTTYAPDFERINYDTSINFLHVVGGMASDHFYVDDNSAIIVLDGVGGNDTFQFGQLFGADRTPAINVARGDEIGTVQTTSGFLSRGISYATTAYAGAIPATGSIFKLTQTDQSNAPGLYTWGGQQWTQVTSGS